MALANLRILVTAVANSASDPAFREMLYTEVEKQFDGEHNVLFKTMAEGANETNARTQQLMTNVAGIEIRMANPTVYYMGQCHGLETLMGILNSQNFPSGKMPFGLISMVLSFILVALCNSETHSQEPQKSKIFPTAGITWRSTAMNFFDFQRVVPDDYSIPYDYERNVQGFSFNTGIQYQITNSIILEYYPNLRYDVTHSIPDSKKWELMLVTAEGDSIFGNSHSLKIKNFLIDHNFNVMRKYGKKVYGIGMTIANSGESYEFLINSRNSGLGTRTHSIEFKTYNAFVTFPLKKIFNLELKAMYIPRAFPRNVSEKYMMYSIRVYYKFDFLNK